jgi:hypothetical protein
MVVKLDTVGKIQRIERLLKRMTFRPESRSIPVLPHKGLSGELHVPAA